MQFWLYFGIVVIYVIGLGVFITFWKNLSAHIQKYCGSLLTTQYFTGPACIFQCESVLACFTRFRREYKGKDWM